MQGRKVLAHRALAWLKKSDMTALMILTMWRWVISTLRRRLEDADIHLFDLSRMRIVVVNPNRIRIYLLEYAHRIIADMTALMILTMWRWVISTLRRRLEEKRSDMQVRLSNIR
mgnify:CR=1 FL=1